MNKSSPDPFYISFNTGKASKLQNSFLQLLELGENSLLKGFLCSFPKTGYITFFSPQILI